LKYSDSMAQAYSEIGVAGTTYELSLLPALKMLGDLSGRVALDFGTGTGRTAGLLQASGGEKVIAVDRDPEMLRRAVRSKGILYCLASGALPIRDSALDVVLCTHVFVEFPRFSDILNACREVQRILRPGGSFVVVTGNTESIGADFVSYRYDKEITLRSGDPITCHMKGANKFDIQDYFWTHDDYSHAFTGAGLEICEVVLPTAENGKNWLDEPKVAADIVFRCRKPVGPI
jgi:ubiquinone/menaquinone biosynthesis C-methylase UbiE